MKGDFTRDTFNPAKHFSRVLLQQGRVGLDADWNEQAEITAYRTETEALDVIGRAGAPKHDPGFAISQGTGGDFGIGAAACARSSVESPTRDNRASRAVDERNIR